MTLLSSFPLLYFVPRFDVHDSSADVKAAPGAYDLPDFAAELERKKKASSRTAVFGSTTKVR